MSFTIWFIAGIVAWWFSTRRRRRDREEKSFIPSAYLALLSGGREDHRQWYARSWGKDRMPRGWHYRG